MMEQSKTTRTCKNRFVCFGISVATLTSKGCLDRRTPCLYLVRRTQAYEVTSSCFDRSVFTLDGIVRT